MTEADLKKHLASLCVREPHEVLRDRALHRATIALSQPEEAPAPVRTWRTPPAWCGVMMLVLAFVSGIYFGRQRIDRSTENAMRADLQTLAQVRELFPERLNAVIERDGTLQIDIARDAATQIYLAQPLVVQIEGAGQTVRVLSYSGRSVTLELKGTRFTFEALVTGEGGVVLSGSDFVWSSEQPAPLAGYRIHAQPLVATL